MACVHFLHVTVDGSQIFLLILEVSLGLGHHQLYHDHGKGQHQDSHQCHEYADPQHHDKYADYRRYAGYHLRQADGKCLVHSLYVVYHPALYLAVSDTVEIFQRQPVDFH